MKWLLQRLRHLTSAHIGSKTRIWPGVIMRPAGGKIQIGAHSHIHSGVLLLAEGGTIHIGDECSLNPYVVIHGKHGVHLGRQIRVATHVVFGPDKPSPAEEPATRKITIEDDVWIGCNVVVMQGARIGKGSVIGAGSVIHGELPPHSIAVGIPAKPIKNRLDP